VLTCYFRHLGVVFEKAGIEVTKENRKEVACIIEGIAGGNPECSTIWRQVKKRLAEDEMGFVAELQAAWNSRNKSKQ
jgi:hypothetical protein